MILIIIIIIKKVLINEIMAIKKQIDEKMY